MLGRPANTGFLVNPTATERVMSKGLNQKKNEKKQPTKTLKEKREAKKAKKQ